MPSLRRQPLTALLALLAPFLLLLGIWFGGHPRELPGFMRRIFVAHHETEVVDVAIDRITHGYYRRVSKSELAGAAITGAVSSLHDRFSNYLTPNEYSHFGLGHSFSGIGVEVAEDRRGLRIVQVFDSSPAARAGLRTGEEIIAVNATKLEGLKRGAATSLITGPPGTNVSLTLLRGRHRWTVTITRATISTPVVASKMETAGGKKLGVVALSTFSAGVHLEVRAAVEHELRAGARGIVLDLRHNGGGLVNEAQLVASIFIKQGLIVTTRGRSQPTITLRATGESIAKPFALAVLVDRDTASASEIVSAALQDNHRAIIVGTHTFGKGVFQEVEELPNGGALVITVGEYFTPDGRNLGGGGVSEGAGITPNVYVAKGVDGAAGLRVALGRLARELK